MPSMVHLEMYTKWSISLDIIVSKATLKVCTHHSKQFFIITLSHFFVTSSFHVTSFFCLGGRQQRKCKLWRFFVSVQRIGICCKCSTSDPSAIGRNVYHWRIKIGIHFASQFGMEISLSRSQVSYSFLLFLQIKFLIWVFPISEDLQLLVICLLKC